MIALRNAETGELQFVSSIEGYEDDPAWSIEGPPLPEGPTDNLDLIDGEWCENVAGVEAGLIAGAKAEAARLSADWYGVAAAKLINYAAKQAEVARWHDLADPGTAGADLFPYASADAAAQGDTIADAVARFEAGIAASIGRAASIEAIEQAAIAAIRNAPDVEAKRAAVAAIDWTWNAPGETP